MISMAKHFRGLLPVVIDLETSGLNPQTDAILEIAIVRLALNEEGKFCRQETAAWNVEPFLGARLDPEALELTKIDPTYPLRYAIPERQALHRMSLILRQWIAKEDCHRAILVGHNVWFDLSFLHSATKRNHLTHLPFHSFTTFDTATLAGAVLGETVLARAARAAKIRFDINEAHAAIYDAERTAELFCSLINRVRAKQTPPRREC